MQPPRAPARASAREHEGALDEVAIRLAGDLAAARAFLCGDAEIVRLLQRKLFLAGVASDEIYADAFEAHAARTNGGVPPTADRAST